MFSFSFKNRIAFNYIATTALLFFVVFFAVYSIVKFSVYDHINKIIAVEVANHLSEISADHGKIVLIDAEEWKEQEHNSLDVNPVFVQFIDLDGKVVEKSPNLKNNTLTFNSKVEDNILFDSSLQNNVVRQIQAPLFHNTKKIGFLVIAMSLEDSIMVLNNLLKIILISYPLVLIILYLLARNIAGRSIKPINTIIETSNKITKDNLSDRISLPQNKDELFVVSQTINSLLDRLENTIEREKQFTSDASHELRTPLAVIKGTLEVLNRKPRELSEYQEKIRFCIEEVDRINNLVDQLLLLTRFENQKKSLTIQSISLNEIVYEVVNRFRQEIELSNIEIEAHLSATFTVQSDKHLLAIIINNLLSNAVKYSLENGIVHITIKKTNTETILEITDNGIGIPDNEITKVFDSFYRTSNSIEYSKAKGIGLGLSIVKRLCDILSIKVDIESKINHGTSIILRIP